MKQNERSMLVTAVLASAPDLVGRWPLLHVPISDGDVLRGIYFERSSDPHGAYVWAFVQPLYVVSETIVLSYGDRLGGGTKLWYPHEAAKLSAMLTEVGVPFIRKIATAHQFAHLHLFPVADDPNWLEAKGCSLIVAGEIADGIRTLRKIPPALKPEVPWMRKLGERTQALADAAEKDPRCAAEILARWKVSTSRALKLS